MRSIGPQPRVHKPLAPTGDPRWTETGAVIQHAATPYYPPTADRRGYACKPQETQTSGICLLALKT